MRVLKNVVIFLLIFSLLFPMTGNVSAVSTSVKRLTAWNMEKKSATVTAGLRNLVVEGDAGQLVALRLDPQTLQVKKLTNIYSPGVLKGPSNAPGVVKVTSEPRLPSYGDWVFMTATSGGKHYLLSIHVSGGGARFFVIPDTTVDGVSVRWSLLWFQLSLTGDRFFGVVRGDVITPELSGSCIGLVTMSTEGNGFQLLARPKWDGEKFYYGENDIGKLISPVGMSSRTGKIFFKAERGTSGKHGIYSCEFNGSGMKLFAKPELNYNSTVSTSNAYSVDYVTDDGKYLVLNDHGIDHTGALTLDANTSEIVAYLDHKSISVSPDGLYSFYKDEKGFGIEFTIGGESFELMRSDDANFPATSDLNNKNSFSPPRGAVSVLPFGYLALSETDITSTGQVYFIGIDNPPAPKKSKLVLDPPVCDFGIVDENTVVKLDIKNSAGTRLSGNAEIIGRQGVNPFSLSGDTKNEFTNLTDLLVSANIKNLSKGFTYERMLQLKSSNAGNLDVPIIMTLNNPNQLLARLGLDRKSAWIGIEKTELKVSPYSEDGTTMVPLRFIIDLLPCDFTWNSESMTAIIDYQDYHFEIGIGKEYCTIGNQTREVTKPAVIKNGQTFIPLRLVAEAFGAHIDWFSESRSILLIFDTPVWGREKIIFEGIPSGAEIKLNYQNMGISPLTLEHMQSGRYMIEVEKEGYKPYSTILDLPTPDGETARVLYFLERIIPTTTTMKVTSDPEEAYVYVDGLAIDKTPCEFDTSPGLHTMKVVLNGYPSFTKEIVCLAGQDMEVHAELSEQKEKLSELVHPTSFSGEININETTEILFDIEIENKLGVAQSFQIECPDGVPVGFDGVYVKTARDEKTSLLTPKIMPGEKLTYMVSVKTDGWVTPGDELKSEIVIYAEDFNTWQFRLPINVVATGVELGNTEILMDAPTDVFTGDRFDVILNISDVFDLSAVETELIYQSKELEVTQIKKGTIFADAKNTIFSWHKSSQNEVKIIGPVLIGNNSVIKNNGSLLKLTFKAISHGDTVIDFSKIRLLDSKGAEIKHNVLNSHVITVLEKITEEDGE